METINLVFLGEAKAVPIRSTVTQRILRLTSPIMERIRDGARNAALERELDAHPEAFALIMSDGKAAGTWASENMRIVTEAYPDADEAMHRALLAQRWTTQLMESHPSVFRALRSPDTIIDMSNEEQLQAACELVAVLIDDKDMTQAQKEFMSEPTFWEDQDLSEVVAVVQSFRAKIQR